MGQELNKQQQACIKANNNVVVVIAGAGSGKTTVLINKIVDIINKGINPRKILALTFTNNAANEIKKRVNNLACDHASLINTFTFHSFAAMILHRFTKHLIHYKDDFMIIDDQDQRQIIKKIVNDDNYKQVLYNINNAKDNSLTHNHIEDKLDHQTYQFYLQYQKYLYKNKLMDFNDLLLYLYELLEDDELRNTISNFYDYILIDEYQDTSFIQDKIVSLLKKDDTKLFIVGDVDQSIYRWRGALIENILELPQKYKDTKVLLLEENYRSNLPIIKAANNLISNNVYRYDKTLFTNKKGGLKVKHQIFDDEYDQAHYIVNEIKFHLQLHSQASIAVLYRKNTQSKIIEDELLKNNIEYQLLAGMKFYKRQEIKDILSYLQLIIDHHNNLAFLRIINTPRRKIGDKTIARIEACALQYNISYFEACEMLNINPAFIKLIKKYQTILLNNFDQGFDQLLQEINYYQYLEQTINNKQQCEEKRENIALLKAGINKAILTTSLEQYLQDINLFSSDDHINTNLILSTVHGVKGLEFDYVYIIGVNQGIFPLFQASSTHELEEERRIMYVAITRAKKSLVLTSYLYDYKNNYELSQFIEEMDLQPFKI